ncbi:MAG: alginate lyase family protein [Bacteroidota bacterium]
MIGKIKKVANLATNMGLRYVAFRAQHEVLKRSGLLKKKFPAAPVFKTYTTLAEWKQQPAKFFFESRQSLAIRKDPQPELKAWFEDIKNGKLLLFNSLLVDLGTNYDWVTNPDSGFRYNASKHWTEIPDYSKTAGDIKFVWEKSRFSYLYDIIRYDYHFDHDCAAFVFSDIGSWIKANPVNCGPNYRCSQEMSLRVLNWTFALHYYRDSPALTEEIFGQMQYVIYWHLHHIYNNIDFSRIAVRNNHAITETLTLYLGGIFYPSMPGAAMWRKEGKAWFEEEIAYQVYTDGTFLQFSMNYHRIVVQLLTWGVILAEANGESFGKAVYDRALKSVQFLRTCMVEETGWLPNYGANDGALFFKLSNNHYRDYRPQLQALATALGMGLGIDEDCEDQAWYGPTRREATGNWSPANGMHWFAKGGYYIIREPHTLTFIKCGSYKDRPSHADNLHIDIWYRGENILLDAGSYKYNTDADTMRYFSGTASHNTVMLDDKDQMLKGGRFIWYYWTQSEAARLTDEGDKFVFNGAVNAFAYISKGILHKRSIIKKKGVPVWEIRDEVTNAPAPSVIRQLWHLPEGLTSKVSITANDNKGSLLSPVIQAGWQSSLYGQKEQTKELYFSSADKVIITVVKVD